MTLPKVETVNAVTMEHGRDFAQGWFDGSIEDACGKADIMTWPEWDHDQQVSFRDLEDDICQRVFDAVKEYVAETFVRIANAAIEEERTRVEEPPPPMIATVEVVTVEHADALIDVINEKLIDSGAFIEGFAETRIMTWPDDESRVETDAQKHYNALADEIRDRLFAETRPLITEAFVRIASEVTTRERQRR